MQFSAILYILLMTKLKDFFSYELVPLNLKILMCVCVCVSHSVMSESLQPHGLYAAHQDHLSKGFSRQEYWSGLPFPSAGDLPNLWIEPSSFASSAFFTPRSGLLRLQTLPLFFFLTNSHSSLKSYLVCSSLPEGFPDFLEDIRSSCSEPLVSAFIILVIFSKALSSVCGRWGRWAIALGSETLCSACA